jgi:molybdenum cofactor biosynthesis enzyme MoaA
VSKSILIEQTASHDVIIWGARMTGLGALRFLRKNGKNPVCFVDSDPAFNGIRVGGLLVLSPSQLSEAIDLNNWNPFIIISVSLKEVEVLKILKEHGLNKFQYSSFQSLDSPYFTVDILGSCNLACASCAHSIVDHMVPKGSMSFDNFTRVIDKIKMESPETTHISLYSWGEPLLHPRVNEIVDYVHKNGMAVALSSNLSLNFDQRLEKLIKSNPEYLKVSVSGYYPEAYNATHQGGDINLVKSNLYRIRHYIDKHQSTTLIDINYHLYRDNNRKNLAMFKEFANELGFMLSTVYALVMPLERVVNYLDGKPDKQTLSLRDNLLVDIDEAITVSTHAIDKSNKCPFRENQVNINSDLTVPVCCTVFEREGNIVAEDFLIASLSKIEKNKKNVKTCERCMKFRLPEYNMGFNQKKWHQIADKKESLDIQ